MFLKFLDFLDIFYIFLELGLFFYASRDIFIAYPNLSLDFLRLFKTL